MKKTLLLSAALVTAMGAFAQTDVTPANYKFYNGTLPNMHPVLGGYLPSNRQDAGFSNNINIAPQSDLNNTTGIWKLIDGDKYWGDNNGLVVLSSGGGLTNEAHAEAIKAWNSVDFGGEIGKAAMWIGKDCDIVDYLNDNYPGRSDEWNSLNQMQSGNFGGGAFNFFMDPKNCPTSGYIHCKIVLNVYDNEFPSGVKSIQGVGVRGDQNNMQSEWGATKYDEDFDPWAPENGVDIDACMDDNSGEWDPKKWVTYEFDFTVSEEDKDGVNYTPARIKFFPMNGGVPNTMAIIIREITFTHMYSGTPDLGKRTIKISTKNIDIANAGSQEPGGDDNSGNTPGGDDNNPGGNPGDDEGDEGGQTPGGEEDTNGLNDVYANSAEYSIYGNTVTFSAPATVYNLMGARVAEGETATLNSGVYVAKVGDKSIKFVIR